MQTLLPASPPLASAHGAAMQPLSYRSSTHEQHELELCPADRLASPDPDQPLPPADPMDMQPHHEALCPSFPAASAPSAHHCGGGASDDRSAPWASTAQHCPGASHPQASEPRAPEPAHAAWLAWGPVPCIGGLRHPCISKGCENSLRCGRNPLTGLLLLPMAPISALQA